LRRVADHYFLVWSPHSRCLLIRVCFYHFWVKSDGRSICRQHTSSCYHRDTEGKRTACIRREGVRCHHPLPSPLRQEFSAPLSRVSCTTSNFRYAMAVYQGTSSSSKSMFFACSDTQTALSYLSSSSMFCLYLNTFNRERNTKRKKSSSEAFKSGG